jgi:pimeloyl-ACP methyl ester carboxylesterase
MTAEHTIVDTPMWFTRALDMRPEFGSVDCDGAAVHYRAWGDPADPGVLLVHGSAANASWWDHIVPLLARGRRVVALDLTGHGDSGRRASYGYEVWARDVLAVLRETLRPEPVVVAHSMGGKVAFRVAVEAGDMLGGVAFLDSNFARGVDPERAAHLVARASGTARIHPDRDSAVGAFRPVGTTVPLPHYLGGHVAGHSVRRTGTGWTWKFDPAVFASVTETPISLRPLNCPVAVLRAGVDSVIDDESHQLMSRILGPGAVFASLETSGHHMMFDAPCALTAKLQELLTEWA